ncbi:MAG: phosphoglycerate mutase family protein, partial [Eubacteriales bacterium]|nr:phosphoglycerate mutase family protein [Eubacteriales bacterium]
MDILLVRHAAAQEKSEATQDMARPLTQEGWECFDARLLGLCRHLPPKGQVFIWTSPAARAMETARIIAREC